MAPSRATYEVLPRSSDEFIHDEDGGEEFKDKPILRPQKLRRLRRCISRLCRPVYITIFFALLLAWQVVFNVPYADSRAPKFEIDREENVFIAANILDGELVSGAWGRGLLELVERIGKERVFVSVYGGPATALRELEGMLECESSLVAEEEYPLDLGKIQRTTLPTGEKRVKRIAFLAEIRNKALEPLRKGGKAVVGGKKWDKVLFINDVHFDAEGALRLLWGTNVNEATGKAEYKAVCAADFVTSWKYYDTFATRDAEGFSLGVPIFPWFSSEGEAVSRKDILQGKDAVRVKSCWGGMVAFDGRYFQADNDSEISTPSTSASQHKPATNKAGDTGIRIPSLPLTFRSEPEPFWDSSECCLIHADIMALPFYPPKSPNHDTDISIAQVKEIYDMGIYMNPFVRVAYDTHSFKWMWLTKRFERAFALPQKIINYFASMPRFNYRRTEKEGQSIPDELWISVHSNLTEAESIAAAQATSFDESIKSSDVQKRATLGKVQGKEYWANEGYYVDYTRKARRGGYCGVRQLLVFKESFLAGHDEGGGNWDNLLNVVPPLHI